MCRNRRAIGGQCFSMLWRCLPLPIAPPRGLLTSGNRIKQKIPLPHTVPIHRAWSATTLSGIMQKQIDDNY